MGRGIRTFVLILLAGAIALWSLVQFQRADARLGFLESDATISATLGTLFTLYTLAIAWREFRPFARRWQPDPATTIAYRFGWLERFGFLIVGAGALAAGASIQLNSDKAYDGVVWIMLGIVWIVRGIWTFVRSSAARLTLSPDGLNFTEFAVGLIPWAQIKSAQLKDVLRAKIDIELHDQYAHKQAPDWEHRGLVVRCGRFDVRPEQMLAEIQARLTAFGTPTASASN